MQDVRLEIPRAYLPLYRPSRYKGAFGGRGSGKSHNRAEALIMRCANETTRWACIREIQHTLKDSVHQLLEDKIQKFGLGSQFLVLENEIRCANGSNIIFRGMQSFNAENIKSLEGFDGAWVEEAQTLSEHSLRLLRPTLRKEGSEIWFTWNPRHDSDPVDKLFRRNRPTDAICVEVNWYDNPWFTSVMRQEMIDDYAADADMADHVWGGGYLLLSEGAFYARALIDAEREGRIGDFPFRPGVKVKTSWDLGIDDYTAIWFFQDDGFKITVVDYYECSGDFADEIVSTALPEVFTPPRDSAKYIDWDIEDALIKLGRDEPFDYGAAFLPHDIKVREWGSGMRSRVESLTAYGLKYINRGAAQGAAERVAAVRKILPIVRFNNTPRVQVGINRLRRYRRKYNDALQTYQDALHDENSHGADAFGEYAINCGIAPPPPPKVPLKISTKMPTLAQVVAEHDKHERYSGDRI